MNIIMRGLQLITLRNLQPAMVVAAMVAGSQSGLAIETLNQLPHPVLYLTDKIVTSQQDYANHVTMSINFEREGRVHHLYGLGWGRSGIRNPRECEIKDPFGFTNNREHPLGKQSLTKIENLDETRAVQLGWISIQPVNTIGDKLETLKNHWYRFIHCPDESSMQEFSQKLQSRILFLVTHTDIDELRKKLEGQQYNRFKKALDNKDFHDLVAKLIIRDPTFLQSLIQNPDFQAELSKARSK